MRVLVESYGGSIIKYLLFFLFLNSGMGIKLVGGVCVVVKFEDVYRGYSFGIYIRYLVFVF